MKRFKNDERQAELKTIAAIPDDQIDLSDIPELTEEQPRRGIRGQMYRPLNQTSGRSKKPKSPPPATTSST